MKTLSILLLVCLGMSSLDLAAQGDIPRLPWGKPDFNGVWARPYVSDMGRGNGRNQIAPEGGLPFTKAGENEFARYNPSEGDYTGVCLPFGMTRAMNSPDPIQFVQTQTHFAYLYEQNTWFKVVNLDGQDRSGPLPASWHGHSTASWDNDTLVITTKKYNGRTRLDTIGHPHSEYMTLTERFTLVEPDTMEYEVTVDDPVYYSRPWVNRRIFTREHDFELIEYSCMENNKSIFEGRILFPDFSQWHQWKLEDTRDGGAWFNSENQD